MKVKVRPLADRVFVKRVENDEKLRLIIIPDTAKEKPQKGEVLAVGTGRYDPSTGKFTPLEVKKGDKILMGKYSGVEIKVDDEDFLVIREEEILAVIEEK